MVTRLLRILLTGSLKPFTFTPVDPDAELQRGPDRFCGGDVGLYIHVPFCTTLCDFCPYFKVKFERELMKRYAEALLREIEMEAARTPGPSEIRSLYFGGGTPALAAEHLREILDSVIRNFGPPRTVGMELHPSNLDGSTLDLLKKIGVTMVSVGAQSFTPGLLDAIGRTGADAADRFTLITERNFDVVDTDIMFAVPGQDEKTLEADFRRAARLGADQISAYPFIRFSFAGRRYPPPHYALQRRMLARLVAVAAELGYRRTSVWTFARPESGRYSSVTRDNVIGFGPSATSLFRERFTINTFSVDEYCTALNAGRSPRALELRFTDRVRKLYWLFWSTYNMEISGNSFRTLFDDDLEREFGTFLRFAGKSGILEERQREDEGEGGSYRLTDRGALLFHRVEQSYTHQYIDRTWRICNAAARPTRFRLY